MTSTYAQRIRQQGDRSLGTATLSEFEEMTYDQVLARMFPDWTIQSVARADKFADVLDPDVRALRNVISGTQYVYYPHRSNPDTTDMRLSDEATWKALPVGLRHLAVTGPPVDEYETAGEGVDFALAAYAQWRDVQHRIDQGDYRETHQVDLVMQAMVISQWAPGNLLDRRVRANLADEGPDNTITFRFFIAAADPLISLTDLPLDQQNRSGDRPGEPITR